jgi:glycine cleavage system H lipoate-binding protein
MKQEIEKDRRIRFGYGSSYRKGAGSETKGDEIEAVLGGQVWKVKPDHTPSVENRCLWMQSGAVRFKTCNNFFDCAACRFDREMKKRVESGKLESWQSRMRRRSGLSRICRHSLTGRIGSRSCAYDYACDRCDFDQLFEEAWSAACDPLPAETFRVKGFAVPADCYFHAGHAWARVEAGGCIRVGLDDFAFRLLGRPDRLELPLMGKKLSRGAAGWRLARKGNRAEVLSPVNGIIMESNTRAGENPEIAHREPYGGGWLFLVRTPDIREALAGLMENQDGLAWISEEVERLERMVEEIAGPLAADGGYLTNDIYGSIPELGWKRLTEIFLRT